MKYFFVEKQQSMNHLYFIKLQASQKKYLKNKIILEKKQNSLIEYFKILYHFWHKHATVASGMGWGVPVADCEEVLGGPRSKVQQPSKFMCVCRL